jgi:hypothetical protein
MDLWLREGARRFPVAGQQFRAAAVRDLLEGMSQSLLNLAERSNIPPATSAMGKPGSEEVGVGSGRARRVWMNDEVGSRSSR